jgi:hypothetical protein
MEPGHHSRQKDDPGGINPPPVTARQPLDDRALQLFRRRAIAEDAVPDTRGERLEDGVRRAEIGIGDPQRDDVAAGVTVPAQAPCACAINRGIKIYFF